MNVVPWHQFLSTNKSLSLRSPAEEVTYTLGWFDCTEPSLGTCTSIQGKQGVQGAYAPD